MVHEVTCITRLNLSLGNHGFPANHIFYLHDQEQHHEELEKKSVIKFDQWLPSLKLGLARDQESHPDPINLIQQASNSTVSVVSSFFNPTSGKRDRDDSNEVVEKVSSKVVSEIEHDESEGGARKKLRLTKEQTSVLEESFKQHNTLNPKQKKTLATSLDLRPRQVEVWYQNRRARTKLKQNEVDYALLKKCYEELTSDNRNLEKEIQELKALIRTTTAAPLQFPTVSHSMCPSCERSVTGSGSDGGDTTKSFKTPISRAPKSHTHLFGQRC